MFRFLANLRISLKITLAFSGLIAVAPVLFVVGLIIMSESLKQDEKAPAPASPANPANPRANPTEIDLIELVPRIPAPLAIVLTPLAGFEIGIAAGIIFYAVFHWMIPKEIGPGSARDKGEIPLFLIGAALISVAIRAKLFFVS